MWKFGLLVFGLCLVMLVGQAPGAFAAGEIKSFSFQLSTTQAGAHPDISIRVGLGPSPQETAERISFDWPTGLNVLSPAVPTCDSADFALGECSSDSQLGLITIREAHEGAEAVVGTFPVFALEPTTAREFARFGFAIPGTAQPIYGELWAGDAFTENEYAVSLTVSEFPRDAPLAGMDLELWGVPADDSHDAARFPTGTNGCPGLANAGCNSTPVSSSLPVEAQIESATGCSEPNAAMAILGTYEDNGTLDTATSEMPQTTGCDQLSFDPSADLALTIPDARSPTGLELDLEVPQSQSVVGPAPSELRAAEVVFEGGVFPGPGTDALGVCPEVETGFYGTCPEYSRVGTATVDAALWPTPLQGAIYYGGEMEGGYLGYVIASGHGFHIALPFLVLEEVEEDGTEIGVIAFESLPQLPISRLLLDFPSAAHVFETDDECGDFDVKTYFAPWAPPLSIAIVDDEVSLISGPGNTPCPVPASTISLSLSPPSIPADETTTTLATAHVTDAQGTPVVGDSVAFYSSDTGDRVGPVTEIAGGSYSAAITSSRAPGQVTITAIDSSVRHGIAGTATLSQTRLSSAGAKEEAPHVRISRHPKSRSFGRRPVFAFKASDSGAGFLCSVDRKPYRPCSSPLRVAKLGSGKHRFRVLAVSATGLKGEPATFRFTVLSRHRGARKSDGHGWFRTSDLSRVKRALSH